MTRSGTLRPGASRVEIYNDGLSVYVYDRANSDAILALDPILLDVFSPEDIAGDPATAEIGDRGLIVVYELFQDDEIDVEVAVGRPFTGAERKRIGCTDVRFARLDAPSGELCIETPNSFRLSAEIRAGGYSEPGGVVRVQPGRYVLGLHRVDWTVLERRGIENHEAWGLAHEFLTLTPEKSFRSPAGAILSPVLWISSDPIVPRPKLRVPPADPAARVPEIVARVVETLPAILRLSAGAVELAALGIHPRGRFVVQIAGALRQAIFCVDEPGLSHERTAYFDAHPEARRPPTRDPAAAARLEELSRAIERQVARWMKVRDQARGASIYAEIEALKTKRHELSQASEPVDDLPLLATLAGNPPTLVLVPMAATGNLGLRPALGAEIRLRTVSEPD